MHRLRRQMPAYDAESKNKLFSSRESTAEQQYESSAPPTDTLYVAHACRHSEAILALVRECHAPLRVWYVDAQGLPDWAESQLPGVPTIETLHGDVYCGDAAFDYVIELSERAPPPVQQQDTNAAEEEQGLGLSLTDKLMRQKQQQQELFSTAAIAEKDNKSTLADVEAALKRRKQSMAARK